MKAITHREAIQASLDYIEAHLQADITAAELAQRAGFSIYHYYRLFHTATGLPVMQYVLRRRLLHAIYAMRQGDTGIDAALAYGFDTYAGFYKAFLREFGFAPTSFLKKRRSKRPVRIDLMKEDNMHHGTAHSVLKHWHLDNEPITDFYYESSGNKAENTLCVGDRCILKRFRDLTALQTSLALAQELKDTGVDTPTCIPTIGGQPYVQLDGWYYALQHRVAGKEMLAMDMYGEGSAQKARFVGEIIGQLHLVLRKVQCQPREADLLANVRAWALPKTKSILHLSEQFCEEFLSTFQRLYPLLPRQVIHRDPNPGNILAGDDSWGIIDLEMAEKNARLFDPCYAATAILSESFDPKDESRLNEWLCIFQNILQGYDSVVTLTPEEKEATPYMILANQLVCVAWFADQPQYPELNETNRQMTRWLIQHFDELNIL